jgi:hypothetical protein
MVFVGLLLASQKSQRRGIQNKEMLTFIYLQIECITHNRKAI